MCAPYVRRSLCMALPMYSGSLCTALPIDGAPYVWRSLCMALPMYGAPYVRRSLCTALPMYGGPYVRRSLCTVIHFVYSALLGLLCRLALIMSAICWAAGTIVCRPRSPTKWVRFVNFAIEAASATLSQSWLA